MIGFFTRMKNMAVSATGIQPNLNMPDSSLPILSNL